MTPNEREKVASFLRHMAPMQTHAMRHAFFKAAMEIETPLVTHARPGHWAFLLLERDSVQGRKTLERMIEYYDEHDGKADDSGRLFIVMDALVALERES